MVVNYWWFEICFLHVGCLYFDVALALPFTLTLIASCLICLGLGFVNFGCLVVVQLLGLLFLVVLCGLGFDCNYWFLFIAYLDFVDVVCFSARLSTDLLFV